MELKSMKLSKKEQKEEKAEMLAGPERSSYPYGLCLHLDADELEKLGLGDLPKLGAKLKLEAVVEVNSTSQNSGIYGEHKSVDLQIVEMGLEPGA